MKFIDTHIHLQDFKTRCATDIISAGKKAGVEKFVCASIIREDWAKISALYKEFPENIVPAFGLHPWYVNKTGWGWEAELEKMLAEYPKALVGETGLDRLHFPDKEPQNEIFLKQIELAKKYKRPLLIHAVKCQEWLENYWAILPEKFVFHSYNGKSELLKKIVARNGYVSFSASILKNRDKEKILKAVPPERILLETDGPYQSFYPGQESFPDFIPELAEEIARIRGEDMELFADRVYQNSLEFVQC